MVKGGCEGKECYRRRDVKGWRAIGEENVRLRWRRGNERDGGIFFKERKKGKGDEEKKKCQWGRAVETEVNRGCRTLLWALANKWESADICTPSQLRKREREGKTRDREISGGGAKGERMEYTPPWL